MTSTASEVLFIASIPPHTNIISFINCSSEMLNKQSKITQPKMMKAAEPGRVSALAGCPSSSGLGKLGPFCPHQSGPWGICAPRKVFLKGLGTREWLWATKLSAGSVLAGAQTSRLRPGRSLPFLVRSLYHSSPSPPPTSLPVSSLPLPRTPGKDCADSA